MKLYNLNEKSKKTYYTYAMIKPDGIKNVEGILDIILKNGLIIDKYEVDYLNEEIINENYSHCIGRDFYEKMKLNLLSGAVLKMVLFDPEGDAINKYRKILGSTNSSEALKGTIRYEYGNKELSFKNAAHGSGNEIEAFEEIKRFFGDDTLNYYSYLNHLNKVNKGSAKRDNYRLKEAYKDYQKDKIVSDVKVFKKVM